LAFIAFILSSLPASAGAPHDYDRSGTVISVARDVVPVYTIESGDSVYTMACVRIRLFGTPQCDWNGRPIAVGNQVRFRIEGDYAYMPVKGDNEERLMVEMTETKLLPPLPAVQPGLEAGVVLGLGVTTEEHRYVFPPASQPAASANSSSSPGSMAPVVAVPVTGGPPVVVTPTSPASGGVVTGVPATGGAPVTAIPVTPTDTAAPSAAPPPSVSAGTAASAKQWIHVLRVQTASRVYDLACPARICSFGGNPIQTGDPLALRIEKKWAYVSSAGTSHEHRFAILAVRNLD
jgi:hypothetical protein